MKKTDLAMLILIATVSVLVAFFVTQAILGEGATEEVNVKTIDRMSTEVVEPDTEIFNDRAINPAVEVQITPGTE